MNSLFLFTLLMLLAGAFSQNSVAATGGPDAFGYVFTDSSEPGGPVYSFEDISGTGTEVAFSNVDDALSAAPIGFDFSFYGTVHTSSDICTNGFIGFSQTNASFTETILPAAADPSNLIAAWWDDLNVSAAGGVYYQTLGSAPNRRFIVQFQDVQELNSGANLNAFQFKLFEGSNRIEIHYQAISTVTGATIGIENATGTVGLQYFNGNGTPPIGVGPFAVSFGVPGLITVANTNNSGAGSLRQAITDALPGDTIDFNPATMNGQTVTLTSGQLLIDKDLTFDASALPAGLTISGNNASRIFDITVGSSVGHALTGPLVGVDAKLLPLGNYGGPTQTMPPGIGSPAINAATGLVVDVTDQRAAPRVIGTASDLGAAEALIESLSLAPGSGSAIPQPITWTGAAGATFEVFFGTATQGLVSRGNQVSPFTPSPPLDFATDYILRIDTTLNGVVYTGETVNFSTRSMNPVVTTLDDENDGFDIGGISLREALAVVTDGETITFAPALTGGTITLGGSELMVDRDITIDGSTLSAGITISGDDLSGVFATEAGTIITLDSLNITGGNAALGGGIYSEGNLTILNSTIHGNSGTGAIFHAANPLTIANCTFTDNSGGGGALPLVGHEHDPEFDHRGQRRGGLGIGRRHSDWLRQPDCPKHHCGRKHRHLECRHLKTGSLDGHKQRQEPDRQPFGFGFVRRPHGNRGRAPARHAWLLRWPHTNHAAAARQPGHRCGRCHRSSTRPARLPARHRWHGGHRRGGIGISGFRSRWPDPHHSGRIQPHPTRNFHGPEFP